MEAIGPKQLFPNSDGHFAHEVRAAFAFRTATRHGRHTGARAVHQDWCLSKVEGP
jgi:hypothetical protein